MEARFSKFSLFLRLCFTTCNYHFTNITSTEFEKKPYKRSRALALNVAVSWWECGGEELWTMSLGQSNIVAQGDEFHCRGGNQAF